MRRWIIGEIIPKNNFFRLFPYQPSLSPIRDKNLTRGSFERVGNPRCEVPQRQKMKI